MENDQVKCSRQQFSSFFAELVTGSKSKKRLSNYFHIKVPGERSDVSVTFTVREAKAIAEFLNKNLKEE